jgi:hypothetical protein
MPLRDHFHSPLDDVTSWEGFHGQWPAMIVQALVRKLPPRYVAAPRVHFGSFIEIDVATCEMDEANSSPQDFDHGNGGAVATAVWAPARPTLTLLTDLPKQDEYEVRIYDSKRGRRLVAAIEIVSPANKDRAEHRRAFVAKCAGLLQNFVSVAIIDLVTTRNFNLHGELLEAIGRGDASREPEPPPLYAAACRLTKKEDACLLETRAHTLILGHPLPTLPLWLADNLAVPLELEACYEETCRVLRIP